MCENCYHEEYGAPDELDENVIACAEAIRKLYSIAVAGGRCHIVTDDWNLETQHVEYCIGEVEEARDQGEATVQLEYETNVLKLMRPMSEAQRAASIALAEGYIRLH